MLIKTGYPNLLDGHDVLCLNLSVVKKKKLELMPCLLIILLTLARDDYRFCCSNPDSLQETGWKFFPTTWSLLALVLSWFKCPPFSSYCSGSTSSQNYRRNENLMVNEYSSCNLKSCTGNTFWVAGEIWQNTNYMDSCTKYISYLSTVLSAVFI